MNVFLCPKCKGNKTIFNPISLFLSIGLPMAMLIESDEDGTDGRCITKKKCPTCQGEGFLKFE